MAMYRGQQNVSMQFLNLKYASRRPTFLFTTLLYLLELLDLADRLEETFGFGPYYETSLRVFLRRVSHSVSYDRQTF